MLREKILKFWRYRLEVKLSKLTDTEKVEFLANKLVKETETPKGEMVFISTYDFNNHMTIMRSGHKDINCEYTGK